MVELASSSSSGSITDEKVISGDSSIDSLDSTFNLEIPATYLSGDLQYRVSLYEAENAEGAGDDSRAQWPGEGMAAMGERSTDGGLEIVIIPIQYNADGSGRLPDTS